MRATALGWKNKRGTGNRNCRCGSWKQHWLNFSGRGWPNNCCVKWCGEEAEVGAHIFNLRVSGEKIVPMCRACNNRDDNFDLNADTVLVSANQSETCA